MRYWYLQPAFYGEGRLDYAFLPRVLQRLCEQIAWEVEDATIEVADPTLLSDSHETADADRASRIATAVRLAACNLLWVHTDGGSDAALAQRLCVEPAFALIRQRPPEAPWQGVAVVPVREMEAWALVDGDAIRAALGVTLGDDALGLVAGAACEHLLDPKKTLDEVLRRSLGKQYRPGRQSGLESTLQAIAERVSFEQLRRLHSFTACEVEMRRAVQALCREG